MFKYFALFVALFFVFFQNEAVFAKNNKKKKSHSRRFSRVYKTSKHSRKSRKYGRHHGNGPDLKSITTQSPYKEDPNNGINPVETKQPTI